MRYYRISPLHSADVIGTARAFLARGISDPDTIRHDLDRRQWDASSVWAVIREVERKTG
jgi:hypothetical protein